MTTTCRSLRRASTPDKLAAETEAYPDRLSTILEGRHEGHLSLWEEIEATPS